MTNSERFHETMNYGAPDHVPYFEEGIRSDVIEQWHQQGLSLSADITQLYKNDNIHEIELDFDPLSLCSKPPTTFEELSLLKKQLKKIDMQFLSIELQKGLNIKGDQDNVILLRVHSGFFISMGVNKWNRFADLMFMMTNQPDFVREAMQIQGEYISKFLDTVLNQLKVDAILFGEPIGGNEGPLISPVMYENFVLKSYQPILRVARKHGIETTILRSYANIRLLIPSLLKNGFNCLWACEANTSEMDYRVLRKEFGRDLRLIGGIDLDTLRLGKEAIRREMEEKVPALISSGGYIPIADGRIRKDILFHNYVYYRQLLEQIIGNNSD